MFEDQHFHGSAVSVFEVVLYGPFMCNLRPFYYIQRIAICLECYGRTGRRCLKLARGQESCDAYVSKKVSMHESSLLQTFQTILRFRSLLPGKIFKGNAILLNVEDVRDIPVCLVAGGGLRRCNFCVLYIFLFFN